MNNKITPASSYYDEISLGSLRDNALHDATSRNTLANSRTSLNRVDSCPVLHKTYLKAQFPVFKSTKNVKIIDDNQNYNCQQNCYQHKYGRQINDQQNHFQTDESQQKVFQQNDYHKNKFQQASFHQLSQNLLSNNISTTIVPAPPQQSTVSPSEVASTNPELLPNPHPKLPSRPEKPARLHKPPVLNRPAHMAHPTMLSPEHRSFQNQNQQLPVRRPETPQSSKISELWKLPGNNNSASQPLVPLKKSYMKTNKPLHNYKPIPSFKLFLAIFIFEFLTSTTIGGVIAYPQSKLNKNYPFLFTILPFITVPPSIIINYLLSSSKIISRKYSIFYSSTTMLLGWVLLAVSEAIPHTDAKIGLAARALQGVGIGGLVLSTRQFSLEISCQTVKLVSVGYVQLCGINIGMCLVTFCSIFKETPNVAFVLFSGISGLCMLSLLAFPDTPQWYVSVDRRDSAMRSLKFYRSNDKLVPEMEELLDSAGLATKSRKITKWAKLPQFIISMKVSRLSGFLTFTVILSSLLKASDEFIRDLEDQYLLLVCVGMYLLVSFSLGLNLICMNNTNSVKTQAIVSTIFGSTSLFLFAINSVWTFIPYLNFAAICVFFVSFGLGWQGIPYHYSANLQYVSKIQPVKSTFVTCFLSWSLALCAVGLAKVLVDDFENNGIGMDSVILMFLFGFMQVFGLLFVVFCSSNKRHMMKEDFTGGWKSKSSNIRSTIY